MRKKTIASMRRPGGVSRSIDYLRLSLINPDPADEAAKPGAILELSELMLVAINQTSDGDADCGYFLAELLAYLWKRRSRLSLKYLRTGRLWYRGPNAISNAIGYAKFSSRSHDAVIRVYDVAGNVIEMHEQAEISKSPIGPPAQSRGVLIALRDARQYW